MFLELSGSELKKATSPIARVRAMVAHILKLGTTAGLGEADLAKLGKAFFGPNAPCLLRTNKLHVAHVNPVAEKIGEWLYPLAGYLEIAPQGRPAYRIAPRAIDEQQV